MIIDIWTLHSVLFKRGCEGERQPHHGTLWYLFTSWAAPACIHSIPQHCVCEGMCLCWCCPPSLPAHLFPHCLGLVVWSSEWSPLKWVSLLPVWLSEGGVFPLHFDFIMSVTLSLTLGALYVCHFFIIMLLLMGGGCLRILVIKDMVFFRAIVLKIIVHNTWQAFRPV